MTVWPTPNVADYWDIDDVTLQCEAWTILDPGPLEQPPQLRGDAVTAPYRPGSIWQPRVAQSRTLTFQMAVFNVDPDGLYGDSEAYLWDNWRRLRSTFWSSPGRQLTITKRWDGYWTASASGVFVNGLEPDNLGMQGFRFSADVRLDDPFFYSAIQPLGDYAVGTHDITGDITGDTATPRVTVTFSGELVNPTVTVLRDAETLSQISYTGTVAAGEWLTVVLPDLSWTASGSPSVVNVVSTNPQWITLDPGATSLVVGGSGAGSVSIDYEPAWF